MKTKTIILACWVAGTLLASCDSYLGIKPKGATIPQTAADFETLLNHESVQKVSDVYPTYLTDDVFLPDVAEGTATPGLNSVDLAIKNLYTYQKAVFGVASDDGLCYASSSRIYYYNIVVNIVRASEAATEQDHRSL